MRLVLTKAESSRVSSFSQVSLMTQAVRVGRALGSSFIVRDGTHIFL